MERRPAHPDAAAVRALVHPGERVVGVGIDTADLDDVRAAAERFGAAYLRRVCSPEEADALPAPGDARHRALAVLWAAKEAVTKALAPREDEPWPWPAVAVDLERGRVRLAAGPARLAAARGVTRVVVLPHSTPTGGNGAQGGHVVTVLALALGGHPDASRSTA